MSQTHTTEGEIPHEEITLPCGSKFMAPVVISLEVKRERTNHVPARNEEGDLMFALPGGGAISKAQIFEMRGGE